MNRIFGFHRKYPKEFLDKLAKVFGFEWKSCTARLVDKDKVEVKPPPPPSEKLYYMDIKYETHE